MQCGINSLVLVWINSLRIDGKLTLTCDIPKLRILQILSFRFSYLTSTIHLLAPERLVRVRCRQVKQLVALVMTEKQDNMYISKKSCKREKEKIVFRVWWSKQL